jgi:hypothetical protein
MAIETRKVRGITPLLVSSKMPELSTTDSMPQICTESDINSSPCSSEADDEIVSRVDDELTFEYTDDGDVDIGSYLNSLPKMKDAKMINECPLVYQIKSPKPHSIITTSVETNKIATNGENLVYNIIFRTDELEKDHTAESVDLIKYKNFLVWPQAYCKIDQSCGQLLGFEPVKGYSRIFHVNTTECELVTSHGENIPKNYRTQLSVDRSLSDEMIPTNTRIQVESNSSPFLIWSNTNIRIDTIIMA